MLAGLAGGLQPQSVTWEAGNADNGWAASLAGDLAQTAIMKRKEEPFVGPDGFFNSTICPNEFYLRAVRQPPVFSRLTVAEVNGGIDGVLLAERAMSLESRTEFTLSQIIDGYYSNAGVRAAGSGALSACDRYANYLAQVDTGKLAEEAYIFGVELKNVLVVPITDSALRSSITHAQKALEERVRVLDQTLNDFGPCREQRVRDGYAKGGRPGPGYLSSEVEYSFGTILSTQFMNRFGTKSIPTRRASDCSRSASSTTKWSPPASPTWPSSLTTECTFTKSRNSSNRWVKYGDVSVTIDPQVAASIINGLDIWSTVAVNERGRDVRVDGGSVVEVGHDL